MSNRSRASMDPPLDSIYALRINSVLPKLSSGYLSLRTLSEVHDLFVSASDRTIIFINSSSTFPSDYLFPPIIDKIILKFLQYIVKFNKHRFVGFKVVQCIRSSVQEIVHYTPFVIIPSKLWTERTSRKIIIANTVFTIIVQILIIPTIIFTPNSEILKHLPINLNLLSKNPSAVFKRCIPSRTSSDWSSGLSMVHIGFIAQPMMIDSTDFVCISSGQIIYVLWKFGSKFRYTSLIVSAVYLLHLAYISQRMLRSFSIWCYCHYSKNRLYCIYRNNESDSLTQSYFFDC